LTSELEQEVRELDDKDKRIYQSARRIAEKLNRKFTTVTQIIRVKRRGFDSLDSYSNFRAQTRGYINRNEYSLYCYQKKKGTFRDLRDFQEREGLNSNIAYFSPLILDNLPSDGNSSTPLILEREEENKKISLILESIIKKLPSRQEFIIKKRFYEGKTLEEAGKELNLCRERIRQIETKALKKLYYLAKKNDLYI